jgi:hypothetical protein
VNQAFETLCNAVLMAPTWKDAMAGVHAIVNQALTTVYSSYMASSHPVHDRPTFDVLREILAYKKEESTWYEGFCRRYPHTIDAVYESKIREQLAAVDGLARAIEPLGAVADVCGKNVNFQMFVTPGRVKDWNKAPNVMPFLELNWGTSVEARRMFFMIAYCWEMGVAEQQLRWIYHADFMPFEFIHAESRHMWDESRHGDSGYCRLKDFGLDFEHFGYSSYGINGEGYLPAMTPKDVYQVFYGVTQIAETGYFETKRYCFEDFLAGRDDASAEMMQFDIIDETSHVEYGRIWLNDMMKRAGVTEDYRKRGAAERIKSQQGSDERVARLRRVLKGEDVAPITGSVAGRLVQPEHVIRDPKSQAHYEWLMRHVREQCPLKNTQDAPVRPNLPM